MIKSFQSERCQIVQFLSGQAGDSTESLMCVQSLRAAVGYGGGNHDFFPEARGDNPENVDQQQWIKIAQHVGQPDEKMGNAAVLPLNQRARLPVSVFFMKGQAVAGAAAGSDKRIGKENCQQQDGGQQNSCQYLDNHHFCFFTSRKSAFSVFT